MEEEENIQIKPKNMSKTTILTILALIAIIGVVINTYQISSIDSQLRKAEDLFGQGIAERNQLRDGVVSVNENMLDNAIAIESNRENIAQLWYASISDAAFARVEKWYATEAPLLSECLVQPIDLQINDGFMGYEGKIGSMLIINYEGDKAVTFDSTGKATCYKGPYETMTPDPVLCQDLCPEEPEESEEEVTE